jgi:hypothetical protein
VSYRRATDNRRTHPQRHSTGTQPHPEIGEVTGTESLTCDDTVFLESPGVRASGSDSFVTHGSAPHLIARSSKNCHGEQ